MSDTINIKKLNLEELSGVITLYPWYGAARKELCERSARLGSISSAMFDDAAMYIGDRRILASMVRKASPEDWSDKDVHEIIASYLRRDRQQEQRERSVRVVGGDYFTQAQYDDVRDEGGKVFSRMALQARSEGADSGKATAIEDDVCTETLAQIYAEQGYYDQSRHIYSRLLLKFPEKSAYFASLIEKLDQEIKINA